MSNEIAPLDSAMKEFTSKIERRVREEVADSIPDSVIDAMVQKTTDRLFFAPTKVPNPKRGWDEPKFVDGPSEFEKMVERLLRPMVEEKAKRALEENNDLVGKAIDKAVEKGFANLFFMTLQESILNNFLASNSFQITEQVLSDMRIRGLSV